MRTIIVVILAFTITANCHSIERTEAQQYYDLALSYIKSDLYEDGLKALNQVAFLYPDSDVADDALYQLALIRERVGDGELNIAHEESLQSQREVLKGLTGILVPDIVITIMAHSTGKAIFDKEKEKAIAQYLLALDYLNTLQQRYPDSNKLEESELASTRITTKIDALVYKQVPKIKKVTQASKIRKLVLGAAVTLTIVVFMVIAIEGTLNN